MELRIHICATDEQMSWVRAVAKSVYPDVEPTMLREPEIVVEDHSGDLSHPVRVNAGKRCLVFMLPDQGQE